MKRHTSPYVIQGLYPNKPALVIPLATQIVTDAEPLRLRVQAKDKLEKDSVFLIDQIRAIDNRKLISGPLLSCDDEFMVRVYQAVQEVMGY